MTIVRTICFMNSNGWSDTDRRITDHRLRPSWIEPVFWRSIQARQIPESLQRRIFGNWWGRILFTGRTPFLSPNQQCQSTQVVTQTNKQRLKCHWVGEGVILFRHFQHTATSTCKLCTH